MLMKKSEDSEIADSVNQIKLDIENIKNSEVKIFLTSSLQSHSLPLVHIIHSIDNNIPIFFLDTGYHFPETIQFKDKLKKEFNFNINELTSPIERINQRDGSSRLMYASDPDYCCYMNKVLPLEPILKDFDVWVSGVRGDQSSYRSKLKKFEKGKYNIKRYHPIIDWTPKMVRTYIREYNLPAHPLEEKGYFSIGCMPCTRKPYPGEDSREMRWFGMDKTECGLHTEIIEEE